MKHETDKEAELNVEETEQGFETWATKDYITSETAERIQNAQVLVLPVENFRDVEGPLFPSKTEEFYRYLRANVPKEHKVEICIEDEDYQELALHYDLIILAGLLVADVSFPIVLNVVSDYIYAKLSTLRRERAIKVTLSVVVDKKAKTKSKTFTFEGTPDRFPEACKQIKELWKKE